MPSKYHWKTGNITCVNLVRKVFFCFDTAKPKQLRKIAAAVLRWSIDNKFNCASNSNNPEICNQWILFGCNFAANWLVNSKTAFEQRNVLKIAMDISSCCVYVWPDIFLLRWHNNAIFVSSSDTAALWLLFSNMDKNVICRKRIASSNSTSLHEFTFKLAYFKQSQTKMIVHFAIESIKTILNCSLNFTAGQVNFHWCNFELFEKITSIHNWSFIKVRWDEHIFVASDLFFVFCDQLCIEIVIVEKQYKELPKMLFNGRQR